MNLKLASTAVVALCPAEMAGFFDRCGHARRVHGRHSAGSSRVGTRPNTLRIGCTELKAVPHAGLGFHFLRVPVGSHRILGVFKRKGGPKGKDRTTNEQADDVRSHLQMH